MSSNQLRRCAAFDRRSPRRGGGDVRASSWPATSAAVPAHRHHLADRLANDVGPGIAEQRGKLRTFARFALVAVTRLEDGTGSDQDRLGTRSTLEAEGVGRATDADL